MFFYQKIRDIINQIAILSGTNAFQASDVFGWSVSLNGTGDVAVIGSRQDEISDSGVLGTGTAYVFRSNNDVWFQEAILTGSLAVSTNDFFGTSVSINKLGNLIVVGADNDEATGFPGGSGTAYIFRSGSGGWLQEAIISGSQASVTSGSNDSFGWSVKLNHSGNVLFVSSPVDEAPGEIASTGLLYVFRSGSNGWIEEKYLSGSFAKQASDQIGFFSLNFKDTLGTNELGDLCVIGAPSDEIPTNATSSGVAYVFRSGSNGWYEEQVLSGAYATGSSDVFGISTDMNKIGNLIAVGAPVDEYPGSPSGMGLVYIFRSGSNGWYNEQIINGNLALQANDIFGTSVAFNEQGNILFVGAYQDEFPTSVTASHGLAYMFRSGSDGWKQSAVFGGSEAINVPDAFGGSIACNSSGDCVLVGAYQDESVATGASGSSGLSYVFKIT